MSGRRNIRVAVGGLLSLVAAVAAGGWIWSSQSSEAFRRAAPLDVSSYVSGANSLRGNAYKLEGEMAGLLAWSPTGRLMAVEMEDGRKRVPVLLPSEHNALDIQKGMKFRLLLVVDDQGLLRVSKLAKL